MSADAPAAARSIGLLDYKSALVTAQLVGYALSKILGIKLISELGPGRRAGAIVGLIALSWLALLLFAIVPAHARRTSGLSLPGQQRDCARGIAEVRKLVHFRHPHPN